MSFRQALRDSFAESVVGQGIYYASQRKLFRPYYEQPGYLIQEKYYPGACSTDRSSATSISAERGEEKLPDSGEPKTIPVGDVEKSSGGVLTETLVTWDSDDDPANPKNWSPWKKAIQVTCLSGMTLSAYMGTAIFTPSAEQMIAKFGCTETQFELGITLFVWGYGFGPLLFAPMSESPHFGGRLYTYFLTGIVFCALQLATALINHVASFAVLRLLAGIFAASPLTTGAGTLADMFNFPVLPMILSIWSLSFVSGPYIGPLIGAALTHANTWRWSFYFLLILSGATYFVCSFLMVETSMQELHIRKGRFLRKETGNPAIVSQGELKGRGQTTRKIIKDLLWGPIDLCLHEPVLNFINLHLGLAYALLYLFFECFPLIYTNIYHFTNVELGLAFVSLMVGFFVYFAAYVIFLRRTIFVKFKKGEAIVPEKVFIPVCIVGSLLMPIGIFIVGWASTYHAHWVGSMVGAGIFAGAIWLLFQTYLSYIGGLYPFRFASAMAANTLTRSLIGGAFPLFGRFLYLNTGSEEFPVGWGCSILAFCGIAMTILPIYLLFYGEGIRAKAMAKYGNRDV